MSTDRVVIHWRRKRRRLTQPETLITLKEYAELNFISIQTAKRKIQAGHAIGFKRANKWWVRKDPFPNE